jgi:hypothetical protein
VGLGARAVKGSACFELVDPRAKLVALADQALDLVRDDVEVTVDAEQPLDPCFRHAIALDVSPEPVAHARRRSGRLTFISCARHVCPVVVARDPTVAGDVNSSGGPGAVGRVGLEPTTDGL